MSNHAIALAVLSDQVIKPDTRILICTRFPNTNPAHPNVVSVPTQRIPGPIYDAIAKNASLAAPYISGRPGSDPVTYAVQSVFSHKLCMGGQAELGHFDFIAAPRSTLTNIAPILGGADEQIEWSMVQVAVHITTDRLRIPEGTSSYFNIMWLSVSEFIDKSDNDGFMVGDKRSYTIGGLCVSNTAHWLKESLATHR